MMSWTLTQIFESSMWWYNAIFDWATLLWDQNSCLIDRRESLNWEFWNPSGYKMVAPIRSSVPWRQRLWIRDLGPSTVLAQSRCSTDICWINVCCRRTQEFSSRQEIPFSWCFAWISVTSWTSCPMHRTLILSGVGPQSNEAGLSKKQFKLSVHLSLKIQYPWRDWFQVQKSMDT